MQWDRRTVKCGTVIMRVENEGHKMYKLYKLNFIPITAEVGNSLVIFASITAEVGSSLTIFCINYNINWQFPGYFCIDYRASW